MNSAFIPTGTEWFVEQYLKHLDLETIDKQIWMLIMENYRMYFGNQFEIKDDEELRHIWPAIEMLLFWVGSCGITKINNELVVGSLSPREWDSAFYISKATINITWTTPQRKNPILIETDNTNAVYFSNKYFRLPTMIFAFDLVNQLVDIWKARETNIKASVIRRIFFVDGANPNQIEKELFDLKRLDRWFATVNTRNLRLIEEDKNFQIDNQIRGLLEQYRGTLNDLNTLVGRFANISEKQERAVTAEIEFASQQFKVIENDYAEMRYQAVQDYNKLYNKNAKLVKRILSPTTEQGVQEKVVVETLKDEKIYNQPPTDERKKPNQNNTKKLGEKR